MLEKMVEKWMLENISSYAHDMWVLLKCNVFFLLAVQPGDTLHRHGNQRARGRGVCR